MNRSERWAIARAAATLIGDLLSSVEDSGTVEEKELVEEADRRVRELTRMFELPEEHIGKKGTSFKC